MPLRGTHHCLLEPYTHLSPTSVVAFIDFKSVFNVANREIILDQLVDFGFKGNLLRWIRGYLSNRTARILFKGTCSTSKSLDLGTPQGGFFSISLSTDFSPLFPTFLALRSLVMLMMSASTLSHPRIFRSTFTPLLRHQLPVALSFHLTRAGSSLPATLEHY